MKSRRYVWVIVATAAILIVGGIAFVATHIPSNDRAWAPEFSKLNTIDTSADGTMLIHNVRDWTYVGTTTVSNDWRDERVDPKKITGAWFFIDFFNPSISLIAHTFLSFDFSDGSTISFSIEARREATEEYSVLGGFIREYELQYVWGTERDFIAQRVVHDANPVRMYHLAITPEQAQAVFESLVQETNTLAANPRFYESITANCTNLLAKSVNAHYPGTLPYDISWQLTGLSDAYLMREGFIPLIANSARAAERAADLTPHVDALAAITTEDPKKFSADVRTLLENTK